MPSGPAAELFVFLIARCTCFRVIANLWGDDGSGGCCSLGCWCGPEWKCEGCEVGEGSLVGVLRGRGRDVRESGRFLLLLGGAIAPIVPLFCGHCCSRWSCCCCLSRRWQMQRIMSV